MSLQIPSEDDWRSEPWNRDLEWAYHHFHGKTLEEATKLFEDNAIHYQEDVASMPSRVFGYYLRAYIAYLLSEASRGDADGAGCFIGLIDFKSTSKPQDLLPLWNEIEPVLAKLATDPDYYDATWIIDGDFRARIHEIVRRGFEVSFDSSVPEVVPSDATLAAIGKMFLPKSLSAATGIQVLRNSGIHALSVDSTREDVIRVMGEPTAAGGGVDTKYGSVPVWIRYSRPDCDVHFMFKENRLDRVTFNPDASLSDLKSFMKRFM